MRERLGAVPMTGELQRIRMVGLTMALGMGLAHTAFASSQPVTGDMTSKRDLQATPLTPSETLQGPTTSATPAQPMPTNPFLRQVTNQAVQDLASRLAVPPERIEFLELKSMLWPNGGLGCPRPGMMYPQVQQDGYLIRLRAGKREFEYHGGARRGPFLCDQSS
jgi:hypothetical protein